MMMQIKTAIHKAYPPLQKAGKAIWKGLTFSLADPFFSFARVVSVSLESDGIYLVHAEKTPWRMTIRQVKHDALPESGPLGPDYVATSVAAFVKECNITSAVFVLGLPRGWAIVRTVDLPLAAKENLDRVIAFELDRLTPLSKDSAWYDWTLLDETAEHVKVLLVVVKSDSIKNYLDALKARGIDIKKITLNVFMMRRLIAATWPNTHAVFLCFKEDGTYEGDSLGRGKITGPFAGTADVQTPGGMDAMIRHVRALTEELVKGGSPPRLIVHADENLYSAVGKHFSTLNVSHLNRDIKNTRIKPGADFSASALGGALDAFGRTPDQMNLMAGAKRQNGRTPWLLTLVLGIILALIFAFAVAAPVYYEEQKLDLLNERLQAMKPEVKKVEALQDDIEKLQKEISAIHSFKHSNDPTLNIIKDMTDILPPKTWLTRLKITDATAEIEGYSSSATDIILKLENTKYFQKVEFASPTFRDPRQGNERFVIKMELKKDVVNPKRETEVNHETKK